MVKSGYGVLCVWPGTTINDSEKEIIDWFQVKFGIRIADLAELHTSFLLNDGTYRIDFVFTMRDEDIPIFVVPRIGTGIKWWGDWVKARAVDYTDAQIEKYREYEFKKEQ